jgi:ribokinase
MLDAVALAVVGSVNQDVTQRVVELPQPGETVIARRTQITLGGKGANQAVAAARMGLPVSLVGAVGDDAAGGAALRTLAELGVDVSGVTAVAGVTTGLAQITVDERGENTIVVDSGANHAASSTAVTSALERLLDGIPAVVLCQGELEPEVVDSVAGWCARLGHRLVLNLAPVIQLAAQTLAAADPLVVNRGEADRLLGHASDDPAGELAARTGNAVVVTLGPDGAVLAAAGRRTAVPARAVTVVDTTGAGDAFCGVLAAALARGATLEAAVRAGVEAGTHAVERAGTIGSYPLRTDLATWVGVDVDEVAR